MKHILHRILTTAAVALTAVSASAYDFKVDGIYYNTLEDGKSVEVTSTGYANYTGDIILPEQVTYRDVNYDVTSVGDLAFNSCIKLTSIEIPNSVTSIGENAFYSCWSLDTIVIPNSVTSIGYSAFSNCVSLTSIEIPNSVTSIGDYAFYFCSKLTSIEIPNSVTSIGDQMFYNCSSLTSIAIPNSVTSIGDWAFSTCTSLGTIEIPSSVTSIGDCVFHDCSSLTIIEIPNSVTSIGMRAFGNCSALKEINVEEGNPKYTSLGGLLYDKMLTELKQCPGALTNVEIPNTVTSIGDQAFSNCNSLTSIEIPSSVTSIGGGAFYACSKLKKIISRNPIPPTAYNDSFDDRYTLNLTLYVPEEAVEVYKATSPWSNLNVKPVFRMTQNPLTYYVGSSVRMNVDVNSADANINWSSDAPEVASVNDDGMISFTGVGDVTVTAEWQGLNQRMSFHVEAVEAEALSVFPAEASGEVGRSLYMLALHTPDNTTDKSVCWESSDPSVAEIDADGRIELKSEGEATITATSGAHTATATVTVRGTTDGIVELAGKGVVINVVDGGIRVLNAPEMARVIVSDIEGRVVTAMYAEISELHIPLAAGVYIVKVGDTTAKLLVK